MSPSPRLEQRLVLSLAKALADERAILSRWRIAGRVLSILGWAILAFTFFKYLNATVVPSGMLLVAMLGGISIGLGIWFTSFAVQWPIVAPFINRQAVEERANELRA